MSLSYDDMRTGETLMLSFYDKFNSANTNSNLNDKILLNSLYELFIELVNSERIVLIDFIPNFILRYDKLMKLNSIFEATLCMISLDVPLEIIFIIRDLHNKKASYLLDKL